MNSLRKFAALPAEKKKLLVRASLVAVGIQIGLRLVRLRTLQRFAQRIVVPQGHVPDQATICWAAAAATLRVPGAACLTRALTTQYLLGRAGYASRLRIGVRPSEDGIEAHAWIESTEDTMGADVPAELRYTVLPL